MTAAAVRGLMRRARSAALATAFRRRDGWPYASLVTVACDCDARPILLLSELADHTRNLAADARASLLFEAASGRANPQTGPRVTVLGGIEACDDERLRRRFLARHPAAGRYAGFSDFKIYRMTVADAHDVGGFARARWLAGAAVAFDAEASGAIAACEPAVIAETGTDHPERAGLFARRLLGRRGDGWQLFAVDPEGCDLRRRSVLARLDFPTPVANPGELRAMLADLGREAAARAA